MIFQAKITIGAIVEELLQSMQKNHLIVLLYALYFAVNNSLYGSHSILAFIGPS
jgi:hypothetical protein